MLEVVYPPGCAGCGALLAGAGAWCETCALGVEETPAVRCGRCSEPGRFAAGTCPRCAAVTPVFEAAFAPFEHSGAVAEAIRRFKYEDQSTLARPLGRLLASESAGVVAAWGAAIWVPIPLHVERFRARGYCQATLLAVRAAKELGAVVEEDWLERMRGTAQQVGQSEQARERNVAGAFVARPRVAGRDVVLVDDVYTTGATARAAAQAVREQGAGRVFVLTLARARRLSV